MKFERDIKLFHICNFDADMPGQITVVKNCEGATLIGSECGEGVRITLSNAEAVELATDIEKLALDMNRDRRNKIGAKLNTCRVIPDSDITLRVVQSSLGEPYRETISLCFTDSNYNTLLSMDLCGDAASDLIKALMPITTLG